MNLPTTVVHLRAIYQIRIITIKIEYHPTERGILFKKCPTLRTTKNITIINHAKIDKLRPAIIHGSKSQFFMALSSKKVLL